MNKTSFYRSWIEIDLIRFKQNLSNILSKLPSDVKYLQVVKADAYGHGAVEISKAALEMNIQYLGVANAVEGILLRESGIDVPIIILGPSLEEEIEDILSYDLTPSVSSLEFGQMLSERSSKIIPIHIEVDTGMGRGGFTAVNRSQIENIFQLSNLRVEGIFSHFPISEEKNEFSLSQGAEFKEFVKTLGSKGYSAPLIHMANSGGFLNYKESFFTMIRIGLLSYGYFPNGERGSFPVEPIMSFKSKVTLIKEYEKGESISYGRTFITQRDTKIAVIPIGYADGLFRQASHSALVLINGQRFPLVGRVSMDMVMADVTDAVSEIGKGDNVTIMGRDGALTQSADDLSKASNTINYEILTNAGRRAVKIYNIEKDTRSNSSALPSLIREIKFPDLLKKVYGIDLNTDFQSKIKNDIVKKLFGDSWDLIREDLRYHIELLPLEGEYFKVLTSITFKKWINQKDLYIGIANNSDLLDKMIHDRKYIYRWLLDRPEINNEDFLIKSFTIGGKDVEKVSESELDGGYCFHYRTDISGRNLSEFSIEMETYYPADSRVFPVYFSDFTKGAEVEFKLADVDLKHFPFFSTKDLHITQCRNKDSMKITIEPNEFIFPENGIIFYWE